MNLKNDHKEAKFPQNRRVLSMLQRGDFSIIAGYAGYKSATSISNIIYGFRVMNDRVKKAIIKLLDERNSLDTDLESRINNISQ